MRRIVYSFFGSFFLAVTCVGIFWIAGSLFGPLYQNEDEANRNFGIFVFAFILSIIIGGYLGFKIATKKN